MLNRIRINPVLVLKRLLQSKVFVSSSLISMVSAAAGLINFLFNIIVSRILGQEKYGEYYSLLSLLMIISLPVTALQFIMSKDISLLVHEKKWEVLKAYMNKLMKVIILFLFAITFILLLSLPFLKSFFHINENMAFYLVFAQIPLTIFAIPFYSFLQSRERFNIYIYNTVFVIFTKFIVGVGLVYLTINYYGILWGLFASQVVNFIFLGMDYFRFKEIRLKTDISHIQNELFGYKRLARSFFYTILSVGAFQLLTYLDSVLVRHFFSAALTGIYSAVNLIGKASFYLATSVAFVMLPLMAKDRDNMGRSNSRALFFLFIVLFAYSVFLIFTSPFISRYIFAGKYEGMENILPLYGFMFLPFAMISFLVNYYVISENLFYSLTIIAGVILQVMGIYIFHQNLIQVSIVVGITGYLILTALLIDSQILKKNKLIKREINY